MRDWFYLNTQFLDIWESILGGSFVVGTTFVSLQTSKSMHNDSISTFAQLKQQCLG